MGSLIASSQISIAIDAPSSRLYDFHRAPAHLAKQPLTFPSFLRHASTGIHYAQRCKFADREF
jgi:hypothetical protein